MMFGNRAKAQPVSFIPPSGEVLAAAPLRDVTPPQSGGFFGEGGVGRSIAGYVGDYLSQLGGGQAIYAPAMQQRKIIQQQEMKRKNDWEDWVRQAQWERDNPKPSTAQPYRWEDNAGNVWERGPDGQNQRIFTDVVPKYYVQGDQAVQIPNPYGEGGAAPVAKPVGKLTPIGAGGPTQPASGGFRAGF